LKNIRPLEGIRVLDLSFIVAGPVCTMLLGDMGAEIIKIEIPGTGDHTRRTGPFPEGVPEEQRINTSGHFLNLNRGKKSLALNLKKEVGRKIFLDLVKISDVVVENFRPGVLERLGLGYYDVLRKTNPRIVYASISGFGHAVYNEGKEYYKSPYIQRPAFDIIVQALGGIQSVTGSEPTRIGPAIGDLFASTLAAYGIMVALHAREKTGKGQHVDVSMYDSMVLLNERTVCIYSLTKQLALAEPTGGKHPLHAPYSIHKVEDGYIVIAVYPHMWSDFCHAMERKDLINHPKFSSSYDRMKNWDSLKPILDDFTKDKTKEELVKLFSRRGIPSSQVNTIEDVFNCPHVKARDMLPEIDCPIVGKIQLTGVPVKLSDTPGKIMNPAPMLGEHTEELLHTLLDYDHEEIEQLRKEGVTD